MKRWAVLVAFLYWLIIVVLTWPILVVAFLGELGPGRLAGVFLEWPYWIWVGVMVLGQLALLTVPVSVANRRPVTRRSLFLPVLVSGLMMGGLATGAGYALVEVAAKGHVAESVAWSILALGGLCWGIWTLVFFRMSRNASPADVVSRQCRHLFKGSILELLIAVPTHLVARSRDYCCAGFMTFVGITLGISVMLFSFGPAVFVLYVDRWKRLHPETDDPAKSS